MEKRKPKAPSMGRPSDLPSDFLKLVGEIFTTNFDAGLKQLEKVAKAKARFQAGGEVYQDEVVLGVSLHLDGQLSATTVYGSVDFDPKASSPTVQDLLSACVDAVGSVFGGILDPEQGQIREIAEESLAALERVPFEWTPIEIERRKIFVRIDKANPGLDRMADDWLKKNDPSWSERERHEQTETEKLFVTGKGRPDGESGPGTVH